MVTILKRIKEKIKHALGYDYVGRGCFFKYYVMDRDDFLIAVEELDRENAVRDRERLGKINQRLRKGDIDWTRAKELIRYHRANLIELGPLHTELRRLNYIDELRMELNRCKAIRAQKEKELLYARCVAGAAKTVNRSGGRAKRLTRSERSAEVYFNRLMNAGLNTGITAIA